MSRFAGRIAVVTGGAQGIGRATAAVLVTEGAQVVIADVNEQQAEATAAELGPCAQAVGTDVTNQASVEELFRFVEQRFGHLDILIANAGQPARLTTLNASNEDWERSLAVNLRSAWWCARQAHSLLARSAQAAIVTVASAHGERSDRSSFPYSAAKGGLLALTRTLAVEYAPGIRVNGVLPGQIESVRTEPYFASFRDPAEARRRVLASFPLRRLGTPEDVAKAIVFLASDDAAWITGTFLRVDGGRDAAMLDLSDLKDPAP